MAALDDYKKGHDFANAMIGTITAVINAKGPGPLTEKHRGWQPLA